VPTDQLAEFSAAAASRQPGQLDVVQIA